MSPQGNDEVSVETNARDQVVIIIDTDHRTTVSMRPEHALVLHQKLTAMFGEIEMALQPVKRPGFLARLLGVR